MSSDLHGLLLVDKESGISSHDLVAKVRKIIGTREVGHSGTLDPMASGLMVLLIGQATKLSQYILESKKSYRVGLRLGVQTNTLDMTGEVTHTSDLRVEPAQVFAQAQALQGDFNWPIPHFSAAKVDGEKLYEKARRGEVFEAPKKDMKFWNVRFVSWNENPEMPEFVFDLECSKGSFVRSWVDQMGQKLGTGAAMCSLIRTSSHPYSLKQAQTLEQLTVDFRAGRKPTCFVPLSLALPLAKRLKVRGQDQALLENGQISYDLKGQLIQIFNPQEDSFVQVLDADQRLLALIAHSREQGFHIRRVFKYQSN